MASKYPPRKRHKVDNCLRLSGLEPLSYVPEKGNMRKTFLNIGERCNVAGSALYKKAIVDGEYDKAAAIATKQVTSQSTTALQGGVLGYAQVLPTFRRLSNGKAVKVVPAAFLSSHVTHGFRPA